MIFTATAEPAAAQTENGWEKAWNTIRDFFTGNWVNIIKFASILIVGIILIWIIMVIINKIMKKASLDSLPARFIKGIVRFALIFLLTIILLMNIGVEITGITAAFSAAVLAVGVALKENIANLANGLVLVSTKKYKTGDYIVCGSVEGSITEISYLFTCLKTPDGKQVMMPNSTMANSQVINFGAYPSRRVQFTLSVAYESDVELVKKIVTDVMKADGRIYLDPEPFCKLKVLGESSIDFFCNCWADGSDYWDVYYYLIETVFNELKKHGISIPFKQIEMRERTDEVVMPYIHDAVTPRVEKKRVTPKKKITLDDLESGEYFPPTNLMMPKPKKAKSSKSNASSKQAPKDEAKSASKGSKKHELTREEKSAVIHQVKDVPADGEN